MRAVGPAGPEYFLRRLEEAVKAYEHCLALDPLDPGALNNHAMALVQLQRWDDALRALDGMVARHPQMADGWMNRAGVLQALGRPEEALKSVMALPSASRNVFPSTLNVIVPAVARIIPPPPMPFCGWLFDSAF